MKKNQQYRQGDVLVTLASIPATAKKISSKTIVLAEGEATGHAHTIRNSAKIEAFLDGQQMYLRVKRPVVLQHQEHSPATIEPGEYVVRRQTEVWLDEVRQVAD